MAVVWGIDLGGTKIEGVVLDPSGPDKPICRLRVPTESEKGYAHIRSQIALVCKMISVLDELTEEELVEVLTETKNALTKQYTKLFAMDNVGLTFTKDALKALAQEAARKGTGARALRAILEKIMLDLMYDLPSREDILEVTINRAVIDGKKSPLIRRKQDKEAA